MPDSQDTGPVRGSPGEARPTSPCVQLCTLDDDAVCVGCGRTLDEIARWSRMSPAEQVAIVERLERTRSERVAGVGRSRREGQ